MSSVEEAINNKELIKALSRYSHTVQEANRAGISTKEFLEEILFLEGPLRNHWMDILLKEVKEGKRKEEVNNG